MIDKFSALLIVDVQKDFCTGGTLAIPDAELVIPMLNAYIEVFIRLHLPVFLSRDSHTPASRHFRINGGTWPIHCLRDTTGAAFPSGLYLPPPVVVVTKGVHINENGYSAFEARGGTTNLFLQRLLNEKRIRTLYIGGLATDFCVRVSTLDALNRGFNVNLLVDAIKGVEFSPGDSQRAIAEMAARGAVPTILTDVLFEDRVAEIKESKEVCATV